MLPLSQDAFIEKTLPQGVIYPAPFPSSPAAGAEQHLEGRVLKVLYWEVYSWKTMDPVMLESRGAEPVPSSVTACRAEHGGRAVARALVAISAAESLQVSPYSLLPPVESACLGLASAVNRAVQIPSKRLLPAGSGEQTSTVQALPLHQPQCG